MSDPSQVKHLIPAAYNPRKITKEQLESLTGAMQEFGDLSGIIVNRRTGNIVGGHQRVKLLDSSWPIASHKLLRPDKVGTIALGYIETPYGNWNYRLVDWDLQKEKAANIAANKHGGDWDIPKLKELLVELDDGSFDLGLTGFNEEELKLMIDRGGELPLPELTEKGKGDLEQTTFILTLDQAAVVKAALDLAQSRGPFAGTGNDNRNGNAIARICEAYK